MDQNYVKNILQNNLKGEQRELMDWTLYDSSLLAASVTQTILFFQNTEGTVGIERTNMTSAGMLPSPQSFIIIALRFYLLNSDGTPIFFGGGVGPTVYPPNVIFNRFTWKLKIDPSIDYKGHGMQFKDQVNYFNDSAALLSNGSNLTIEKYNWLKFKTAPILPANRAFSVEATMTTPAAATGFSITKTLLYCEMRGLLRRNV
jgi:hypothetical protein